MTMILISIELPTTWNPRSKEKKETRKTMKIFELLWKRCFLYTANNGINDFFWRKKRRLEWKKKKTILSWCVMFNFQKKDMFKWKQKHIYSCVNLFFLPINYLASYLYNFICLIMKTPSDCCPATLLLLLLYYKYNSKVNVACSKK